MDTRPGPPPVALALALSGALAAAPVRACDTALLLAVDVSNSIDPGEYRIQADGIAEALTDPVVVDAMVQGRNALAVMQWSGVGMQQVVIPWTRVAVPADMEALSERVRAMPRAFAGGNTAVGEALRVAVAEVSRMGDCARWIVDVSGDGSDNAGSAVGPARRLAERTGVTVNGLAIEGLGPAITTYYQRAVITADGFVETARGFTDFARAIRQKIRREVTRVSG